MNARLAIVITCLVCAAAAVAPGGAGAAMLAEDDSYGLGSAQLDGGALYWWQINAGSETDWDETSRILRRDLAASTVTTAFETDGDDRITAFNAVGGRLIVGVHNPRDGSSRIVEVTPSATGPAAAVLIQRSGDYSGLICTSRVRLLGVNAQSEVLVEELRRASRDANCEDGLLKRTESTITAIAPGGATRIVLERKGGWDDGTSDTTTGRMIWGGGDWFIRLAGSSDAYGPGTGLGEGSGMLNLASGQFAAADVPFGVGVNVEVAASGQSLVNERGRAVWLRNDPLNPNSARKLTRARTIRWLHYCGDKMLEISRRAPAENSSRRPSKKLRRLEGSRWNLYILGLDGTRERRLPQRLRRGTNFATCNAGTAVFHKYLRRSGARQFTVPLAPPAA